MVDVSLTMEMVVAISIVAGTLFAVIQIREIAKDRHTEVLMRFSETWLTVEFEQVMTKLVKAEEFKSGEEAESICSATGLHLLADYFEILGAYVKAGLLKREEVIVIFPVEWSWEKMKPWIIYERSSIGIKDLHETFEWLALGGKNVSNKI